MTPAEPLWTTVDIPNLSGRRALVTGATSGVGEHTATELARHGAEVVLAGRNPEKLAETERKVMAAAPTVQLHRLVCDLADLSSVRRAAAQVASVGPISMLVNNAGVMATPNLRTVDGFDLQFGTNHLGHFALTGLLLEQLADSGDARVVTVSSLLAHAAPRGPIGDPRKPARFYNKWLTYSQSKLANLLFAFELDRRVTAAGLPITSVAAHPGYSHTALVRSGMNLGRKRLDATIGEAVTRLVAQPAEMGALPSLMAATAPGLRGSTYIGPAGPFGTHGPPRVVKAPHAAYDEEKARLLWESSQDATSIRYP